VTTPATHPPSVDSLARHLSHTSSLPHSLLVDCARRAVAQSPAQATTTAEQFAHELSTALLTDVVNATGVLLHTNLGRAPLAHTTTARPSNIEFNLATGERGSRQTAVSALVSSLIGAEAAIVVNNNAAAVMLVLASLAQGRDVAVSRGESVEIGGGFRIPDVMEQSGAKRNDIALVMKIHPSNFSIEGFTEDTAVQELATLSVPVVADIGSGLLDNTAPWLQGHTPTVPSWLVNEPAAKQALADGASLVTFSGDKLLGGPQCGIIAGRADLVAQCAAHPLMRALRPGSHTMILLQQVLLSYASRTVCTDVPFWRMVATPEPELRARAESIVATAGMGSVVDVDSLVGAGSAPGSTIASIGVALNGDQRVALRAHTTPVIARTVGNTTYLDMRSIAPADDHVVVEAMSRLH